MNGRQRGILSIDSQLKVSPTGKETVPLNKNHKIRFICCQGNSTSGKQYSIFY